MAIAAIAIAPQANVAMANAAMATAPQANVETANAAMATVPRAIDEMAIDAIAIDEATTVRQAIDAMEIDATASCAVTPTDAKSTSDSPKASCRTPIRSIWIAKTKGCSMTNQKSPTSHRETIGTETPRNLLPHEKEGPNDADAETRIHN